ncbi:MAG: AraC family transcriptional regulator [Chitinophagaceae bacterium]|jgi:AraC-like DNA-binding protein|nr:AraC family transcriptional regulator [Chitinophagaceae bacterium]
MKVLQFTIPIRYNKTIVTKEDRLPYFYPYLHKHKEMQVTWIKSGNGTLVAGSDMHLFKSNDIFVIGANLPHVFKSADSYFEQSIENATVSLNIFFDPDVICNTLFNICELKHLKDFILHAQTGFKVNKEMLGEVSTKILQIMEDENGMERTLYFIELIQLLTSMPAPEVLSNNSKMLRNSENDGIRISEIYSYILHNYEKDIKLEDVAKQAYLTPPAFCRFFKKRTGRTFVSFLNEIRINEARKKFSEGDYESISSVAYNCGFNSVTNFNRVFKAIARIAPSSYIESFRKNINPVERDYPLSDI